MAPFEPIARLILDHAPDLEVWQSLMQLVDTLESSIKKCDNQSNKLVANSIFRRVGANHRAEKTMEELKESMRHELSGSVFMNDKGFWKKYFVTPKWSKHCVLLSKEYEARSGEAKLKFPQDPVESDVWKWMKAVEDELLNASNDTSSITAIEIKRSSESRYTHAIEATQCHTLAKGQMEGGQTDRQLDYFIKRSDLLNSDRHHWRDVLVVGELKKLPTSVFLDKFLHLCVYMSEVFLEQPLRHFVHGFILFGTQLQLWVFDRSGPYCESIIDVGKSQKKLVHVLAAYMLMSDKEHGIDPNIRYEGEKMIIKMEVPGSVELREFVLDFKPLVFQSALVSRGTTVYSSVEKSFVVKFSWNICGGTSEVDLLQIAKDVVGMAMLEGWRDLVPISTLRKGLKFTHKMVKNTRPAEQVLTTPVVLSGKSIQVLKSTSNAGSRKRKSESQKDGNAVEPVIKRTRSGIKGKKIDITHSKLHTNIFTVSEIPRSVPVVEIRSQSNRMAPSSETTSSADGNLGISPKIQRRSSRLEELRTSHSIGVKRRCQESVDVNERPKRIHHSSHSVKVATDVVENPVTFPEKNLNHSSISSQSEGLLSLSTSDFIPPGFKIETVKCVEIRKRQQAAVAISPFGKSISEFETPLEMIIGLYDAIKAHRSLLLDANILHRDISVNNVLLKHCEDPKHYGGLLIDLDLAILLKGGKEQGKLEAMMGTIQFMALEILQNSFVQPGAVVSHSYRHDLESFFYVLLWICIRFRWPDDKSPHSAFLRKWYSETAEEIYSNKKIHMKKGIFGDKVMERISPDFENVKYLVWTFWKTLFYKDEKFTTGTAADPDTLYGPIIEAFEMTILHLKS
ncbi:serine/threonine protein kinase domain protein [Blumeria hordei DH14]|uniref:non-specific serine/threonine protein kinase n=1 Tax=Blumeria graminis f. sp. hordei (strain DH14) TaxID=546991 RepID=N1JAB3_BLUG1|nr:serine/threonine protein kinase domain protein [Blumeria hordei DH14]